MALDATKLESDLRAMFEDDETAADAQAAAQRMADIYETYALAGTFGANLIAAFPQKAALVSALVAGCAPAPTGAVFASAWSVGLLALWAAVPVAGGGQADVTAPPTDRKSVV